MTLKQMCEQLQFAPEMNYSFGQHLKKYLMSVLVMEI